MQLLLLCGRFAIASRVQFNSSLLLPLTSAIIRNIIFYAQMQLSEAAVEHPLKASANKRAKASTSNVGHID